MPTRTHWPHCLFLFGLVFSWHRSCCRGRHLLFSTHLLNYIHVSLNRLLYGASLSKTSITGHRVDFCCFFCVFFFLVGRVGYRAVELALCARSTLESALCAHRWGLRRMDAILGENLRSESPPSTHYRVSPVCLFQSSFDAFSQDSMDTIGYDSV